MVQDLIVAIRANISSLFKICESVAVLDMISGFAHVVTMQQYGTCSSVGRVNDSPC